MSTNDEATDDVAIFGGGCFWCLEAVFQRVDGVVEVIPGYCGGMLSDPDYHAVCSGQTGHAEVVRLRFDPTRRSYDELLQIFFEIHDPTTLDRQGNDVGSQYRSVIYYFGEAQRRTAEARMHAIESAGTLQDPIVTELRPAPQFWPAETYHRDYFLRNGAEPYCQFVVAPKVAKFMRKFEALRR